MTAEERARLIEEIESGEHLYRGKPRDNILAELRRLDVLEKALREILEEIPNKGKILPITYKIQNLAKQALGDA